MGYLHAGHMSLVAEARRRVGPRGMVVVSIYVNPTQFGPKEDFSKYPRDLARDARLCRAARVDVLFTPSDTEMYPKTVGAAHSTYVVEESLTATMEGAARPGHFRGVTTIVAKLFNLVLPDVAVFGAKDFQQAAVIRRMTRDLNFPTRVVVTPTRREPDGLAMSSRNKYLSPEERRQALAVSQAIRQARAKILGARRAISAKALKKQLGAFIHRQPAARVDYIEFFNPRTLVAEKNVQRGTQMAMAVFIGKTRLIDNGRL